MSESENQVSGYKNIMSNLDNLLEKITDPKRKKRLESILKNLKNTMKEPKKED